MPVDDCFFSLAKKWVLITDKRLSQQRPYKHEIKSILTVSTTVTILSFFSTSVSNKQLNRQVEKIGCKNVWSWDLRKWLPLNYDETNDVAIVIRIRKRWNILIGAPVLEQLQFFPQLLIDCSCVYVNDEYWATDTFVLSKEAWTIENNKIDIFLFRVRYANRKMTQTYRLN